MSQYTTKPMTTDGTIVVCLYCPPLFDSSTIVVPRGADGKVDVGSVSRAFGLDPSTVRLNGHYLSRGPDLVSQSVTWAALLSYFVLKGLPAGRDSEGGAVVVEGKPLLRMGSKRGCEEGTGIDEGGICSVRGDKRVKRSHSDHPSLRCRVAKDCGGSCSKRKCLLEDTSLLKRLKIDDTPVAVTEDTSNREGLFPPFSSTRFECRVDGQNGDDRILAAPLKRLCCEGDHVPPVLGQPSSYPPCGSHTRSPLSPLRSLTSPQLSRTSFGCVLPGEVHYQCLDQEGASVWCGA